MGSPTVYVLPGLLLAPGARVDHAVTMNQNTTNFAAHTIHIGALRVRLRLSRAAGLYRRRRRALLPRSLVHVP
jgi:hypothetical protein